MYYLPRFMFFWWYPLYLQSFQTKAHEFLVAQRHNFRFEGTSPADSWCWILVRTRSRSYKWAIPTEMGPWKNLKLFCSASLPNPEENPLQNPPNLHKHENQVSKKKKKKVHCGQLFDVGTTHRNISWNYTERAIACYFPGFHHTDLKSPPFSLSFPKHIPRSLNFKKKWQRQFTQLVSDLQVRFLRREKKKKSFEDLLSTFGVEAAVTTNWHNGVS